MEVAVVIGILAVIFLVKSSANSFGKEFWKDVEAEIFSRGDPTNMDVVLAVVNEELMKADTGKLPIIIKHAPTPEYRAMANFAYKAKRHFQ